MCKNIFLLLVTLKYLKLDQLAFFVIRRMLPDRTVSLSTSPVTRKDVKLDSPMPVEGIDTGENSFRFLNVTKTFDGELDWAPEDVNRLWRYNLHYFDYLREASRSVENKDNLLSQWLRGNPQGSLPGWEPYTVSLRIVNWIFHFQQNPTSATPELLTSLYTQVLWLEKNDERHILANHYFENLKAFAFAGVFFEGRDADRWLRRLAIELPEQLEEQTLADGGHYERSPHYHMVMLENYLDIYNLGVANPEKLSTDCMAAVKNVSQTGLSFLHDILMPDGSVYRCSTTL